MVHHRLICRSLKGGLRCKTMPQTFHEATVQLHNVKYITWPEMFHNFVGHGTGAGADFQDARWPRPAVERSQRRLRELRSARQNCPRGVKGSTELLQKSNVVK